MEKKEYAWAAQLVNYLYQLDPQDAEAYANRGVVYKLQGNLAAARQDWEMAVELFSNPQSKAIVQGWLDGLEDNE